MKILKISFKNLNSLKGEHSIDLEGGLLGEAGIFAITGPTGAGKSTILDAITLALFGKAARYEKEANPGEMMTRGNGECAAEVLFECRSGRYRSKWTRARARKKPDGKLQGPKREVAKADTGEILAEKLKEADLLVESLTGLDYHRFLRSVLLAQGRFKEFLDAGDNERGELLEKITGTEIYSRISQKAFEIEREHDKKIQAARQRLAGVELQTEAALAELNQEHTEKESALKSVKLQMATLQTKLQRFERHRSLQNALNQSKEQLIQWQAADEAFSPARAQLTQHEATQPFQATLIELNSLKRQQQTAQAAIEALTQASQSAERKAAQLLAATTQQVHHLLEAKTTAIETTKSQRDKTEAEAQAVRDWLQEHATDLTIETQLPQLRTLGESARLSEKEVQGLKSELKSLNADQVKNEKALTTKRTALAAAQVELSQAEKQVAQASEAFAQVATGKSLDEWRHLAKEHERVHHSAQTLHKQRASWEKDQAELQRLQAQRPALRQQITSTQKILKDQEARVAQEKSILEDKQKIYDQARLIATLETHRAALQPNQACPLCGSLEHPYADHLESNQDKDKAALDAQKIVLTTAESALRQATEKLNRLDEQLKSLDHNITQAKQKLEAQAESLSTATKTLGYSEALANKTAFALWLDQVQAQHLATEAKLVELTKLDHKLQTAQTTLQERSHTHKLSKVQLQTFEDKKTEISNKRKANEQQQKQVQLAMAQQLAEFNEQLNKQARHAHTPSETQAHTQALEKTLRSYQARSEAQTNLETKLKELNNALKELQRDQARLNEEHNHWLKKLATIPNYSEVGHSSTQTIADNESQRREACQATLDAVQTATQTLAQKRADLAQLTRQIQSTTETLQARLSESTFDSIESLSAARLTEVRYHELNAQKNALKTQHDQLSGRIAQSQEELKQVEAEGILSSDEAETLTQTQRELDAQISQHNKRLGEITLLLEQDRKARAAQAKQIQAIAELEKEARPWIELNALIGSAKGDKFSKFAQGLTLAQLLQLANQHLLELNDRYIIQRTPESELGLQIIDRYQADAIRPTRSLSGGESFLVSLALALGLSDLAGSDTRIESLFIDEGFGTLDTDTLDTALAALENLRMSNRTIGIISHVDALKQRINAQIRVEKASNGYGTLEIINGT
jgi:exonuclease SbcC